MLEQAVLRPVSATESPALPVPVTPALWEAVDRLVDRAPLPSDLEAHGLQFLAARRWRALGRPLSSEFRSAERVGAALTLVAPVLLERVRAACDGTLVLMKGPEVAAFYPDPALRPFRDLDILVEDPVRAQRALVAAGFEPTGAPELYVGIHHLRPLRLRGLPLVVEVHARPKWVEWVLPPSTEELLAGAVQGASGVDGVLTLRRDHHALALAAHSWAHVPLSRLVHLVDVAAVSAGLDRDELDSVARRWGIDRIWRTTAAVADALLGGGPSPFVARAWARNLAAVRERTVLEAHLEAWLGPFSAQPPLRALRSTAASIGEEIRPSPGETWAVKLKRTVWAFAHAFRRVSEHDRVLEREEPSSSRKRGVPL